MTRYMVPRITPEIVSDFCVIACWSDSWDPSDSPWRTTWCSSPRAGLSWLKWIFGICDLILPTWPDPSAKGHTISCHFFGMRTSFALSLRACESDASLFSSPSTTATKMSPFQMPPASSTYPMKMPGRTFLPNWWSLDGSSAEIGWYSTINPKTKIGPSPFVRSFLVRKRGLARFAENRNIPLYQPIIVPADHIAEVPRMFLPSPCALLFQQSHLFLICVMLTYNHSTTDPLKLCWIPLNYLFK